MSKVLNSLCILFYFFSLVGCASLGEDNSPPPSPLMAYPFQVQPVLLWSFRVGSGQKKDYLRFNPIIKEGKVFVADQSGIIAVFGLVDKHKLWQKNVGQVLTSGPAVNEGIIVVVSQKLWAIALSIETGQVLWKSRLPNEVDATPAIGQDRVIFKTVDGCVLAMDLKTGIHLWSYHHSTPLLVLRPSSAPKIAGDKVIVGFSDGMLVALNLFRGTLLWENNITYPQGITTTDQMIDIAADLVLSNDVIYVVTYQGKLAAVSLQSGRSLWERSFSSYSGLALGYGKLYASDSKGDLWAFRCSTGQLLWHQTQLRYRKVTAPVIFGDSLVIGDGEGYIHWFTQKTGQPLAWYWVSEDNRIISRPAVLYPFVCVQTQEGSLSIITYTTLAI